MEMPIVELTTDKGAIVIELNQEKAPITVANFLDYVQAGHYDGKIFHRVIDGFMIQGGGFDEKMQEAQTGTPIQNEADNGLPNKKYSVAMARTNEVHSATAQFFINVADNTFLNHRSKNPSEYGYAVFGQVIEGQDVVNAIKGVKTARVGYHDDVPVTPVVIQKAVVR